MGDFLVCQDNLTNRIASNKWCLGQFDNHKSVGNAYFMLQPFSLLLT